jgi:HK97 family phage major capsid protein/HK97 family phage prohead protease
MNIPISLSKTMNRAYSVLDVKTVDEDERIITGIATTPSSDRVGDIVEPLGVSFKNPLPLLHQHRSDQPVGTVKFDKATKEGISFSARIPKTAASGPLKDRIDTAWEEIKLGLVRGVSIGFRPIEMSFLDDGGIRFLKSEVLELSLVTIPANAEASIHTIKSIDAEAMAASGPSGADGVSPPPGVAGTKAVVVPVIKTAPKEGKMKTYEDQIKAYEATRQAKAARMAELMNASSESGETLGEAEQTEYDTCRDEVKSIDAHLVRLNEMKAMSLTQAVPVAAASAADASKARAGVRVEVIGPVIPKGIGFARLAIAKMIASREMVPAHEIAKMRWPEMPELQTILKAAVTAGSSTTMSQLVEPQMLVSEFIEYLWPKTIIGRIPGLTRVPFNIKVQRQITVSSVNWVGEGKPKPVSKGSFDTVTLGYFKIAGIVGLTDEIVRFSSPAAEALVRDELAKAIIKLMDKDFLDPEKAAVANTSPASVTNGVTPVSASGTAYANFVTDFASVMGLFDAAEIDTSNLVMITRSRQARTLGLMLNSLGQPLFPNVGATGGTVMGFTVITSNNVDYTEDSPAEGDNIIFMHAPDIFLADDGSAQIDVSREASVQMNDAPDDPATASTVMVSAFQQNLVFVRAERYINWLKRRDAAVQYIKAAKYA